MASAGPCASLHLAPDGQPRQHPTTQFFTGRVLFLPPNQQRQSTEGSILSVINWAAISQLRIWSITCNGEFLTLDRWLWLCSFSHLAFISVRNMMHMRRRIALVHLQQPILVLYRTKMETVLCITQRSVTSLKWFACFIAAVPTWMLATNAVRHHCTSASTRAILALSKSSWT